MSTPQYGIIEKSTIHHPGDERSRTHPGHGYPAYSEEVTTFRKFPSLEALQEHVESKTLGYEGFTGTVVEYRVLPVRTSVTIGGVK